MNTTINKTPVLSICIPTFNRSTNLKICLGSILEQKTEDIEILVSDNNSSDQTAALLMELQKEYEISVFRQSENVGFDRNVDSLIKHARGRYCWLVGDDDIIKPDGICLILTKIKTDFPNLLVFGFSQTISEENTIYSSYLNTMDYFGKSSLDAIEECCKTGDPSLFLMFISTIVFRRSLWFRYQKGYEIENAHGYRHSAIFHNILSHDGDISLLDRIVVHTPLPKKPRSVDSLCPDGTLLHADIRLAAYLITRVYQRKVKVQSEIRKLFKRFYSYKNLIFRSIVFRSDQYIIINEKYYIDIGYSKTFIALLRFMSFLGLFFLSNKIFSTYSRFKNRCFGYVI